MLIIFWNNQQGSRGNSRTCILSSYTTIEDFKQLITIGYDTFNTIRNIYTISNREDVVIFYSNIKDFHIEKLSRGGFLELNKLKPEKIFIDITYNELKDGLFDYHKLFFHQPNDIDTVVIYFKKPPENYNIFIPIYENYLEDFENDILNVLSKTKLRYYTHFKLYDDILINSNKIKIKKLDYIPKKDNNSPTLWKELLPNYDVKYIDIGDRIVLLYKELNYYREIGIFTILDIIDMENYFELTIDGKFNKNYKKENIIVSHYFDVKEIINPLSQPYITNFKNNSHTGNYKIDLYPIKLSQRGSITENIEIKFIDTNICNVILKNNKLNLGQFNIKNEDIEIYCNYVDGNPLWFKMDKNGFVGTYYKDDTIEFKINGKDIYIWFIRYIPKNYNTMNYNEEFILKVI